MILESLETRQLLAAAQDPCATQGVVVIDSLRLISNGSDGRFFVAQFGSLPQADVAASTDVTGQGGDTNLEFQQGQVTAALHASSARYFVQSLLILRHHARPQKSVVL